MVNKTKGFPFSIDPYSAIPFGSFMHFSQRELAHVLVVESGSSLGIRIHSKMDQHTKLIIVYAEDRNLAEL